MNHIDEHLRLILKGTYLSRKEKLAWTEEMRCHLEESVKGFVHDGLSEDEAVAKAVSAFGSVKEVRNQIIRDTYLISPRWFLAGAVLCLVALVVTLYTTMRFDDFIIHPGNPSNWVELPTPFFVVWLHRYFPLNPNRWAALMPVFVMMVFTRSRRDRLGILVSLLPFAFLELLLLVHPIEWIGMRYVFFAAWPPYAPLGVAAVSGCLVLLSISTVLFLWTRNQAVSLTPWFITFSLTAWPFLRDVVQSTLWQWTQNPIFWGHNAPWGYTAWYTFLSFLLRILMMAIGILLWRWLDARPRLRIEEV